MMRLPNVKILLCGPLECIFMALFEIAHFCMIMEK